jgi:hypothetical protein
MRDFVEETVRFFGKRRPWRSRLGRLQCANGRIFITLTAIRPRDDHQHRRP